MVNDEFEFKVTPMKAEVVALILFCLIYATGCILAIITGQPLRFCIVSMVLLVLMIFIFTIAIANVLNFYVHVSGNHIKVRTGKRKIYEFDISEIVKVKCTNRTTSKYGTYYYLNFDTKLIKDKNDFRMNGNMKGFGAMADYLLQKHESGELRKNAISPFCRRELINYRDKIHKTK